ncbi:uncharacterized protein LOC110943151 [Helianthus annuus]|uniref:uncharacterized protein LOC110943151 n=1 Tax=Helianthus annuus TaxID=4232 RepID=UPI000B8F76F1|nr:uncharacterized protein LOC110943151 [Helianthus annuus]
MCDKGTRIIIGWNVDNVDIVVVHATSQVVHTQVHFKKDKTMINVSFVYASNNDRERKLLWDALKVHKRAVHSSPWIIIGDFNVVLNLEDKCAGTSGVSSAMRDFNECVNDIEVLDIRAHGMHFTWNQQPKDGIGVRRKLDRVMGNISFVDKQFLDVVREGWAEEVMGVPMFRVAKKLRNLKHPFRVLLKKQGNIHKKVSDLKSELEDLQKQLDADPFNNSLKEAEAHCVKKFWEASLDEERFLKQKAKQKWLEAGDANTAYFHNVVKCRNHINKINIIKDAAGNTYEDTEVSTALVNHFRDFLGSDGGMVSRITHDVFSTTLNPIVAEHMCRPVTPDEVKAAIFSINENKAPGPDGFTSEFYKKAWDIVGAEVTAAIIDFFESGSLPVYS